MKPPNFPNSDDHVESGLVRFLADAPDKTETIDLDSLLWREEDFFGEAAGCLEYLPCCWTRGK